MSSELRLRTLMERQRDEWVSAVREAETELEQLRRRQADVEGLISRARYMLGEGAPASAAYDQTLHAAMVQVLREHPDGLSARQLADHVNKRGLYRQRNGSPVPLNQIHARASNYRHLFTKEAKRIKLARPS